MRDIITLIIALIAIAPGVYAALVARKNASAVAVVDNRKVELEAYKTAQEFWETALAGMKEQLKEVEADSKRTKEENRQLRMQLEKLHEQVQFFRGALQANGITLPKDLT